MRQTLAALSGSILGQLNALKWAVSVKGFVRHSFIQSVADILGSQGGHKVAGSCLRACFYKAVISVFVRDHLPSSIGALPSFYWSGFQFSPPKNSHDINQNKRAGEFLSLLLEIDAKKTMV